MIRRRLYGWYDSKKHVFRVSWYPADSPVRPSVEIETKAEVDAMAKRKRADVFWWPPLPPGLDRAA